MVTDYVKLENDQAYRLINHGPVLLVSSCSAEGRHDIAPIAWNCPVKKDPTRILLAVGKAHQTYRNIEAAREFIASVPVEAQAQLVRKTGSYSGADLDKFKSLAIEIIEGKKVNAWVPAGCLGYIECKVLQMVDLGSNGLIIGESVYAAADRNGFDRRVLVESPAGRTLHHLGDKVFAVPADGINT